MFQHMISSHWECVNIVTKQSTFPAYPGWPEPRISDTAVIGTDGWDYFQVVDNYKKQIINFYIVGQESRFSTFLGAVRNEIEMYCVATSTTLYSSAILPNLAGKDYY